VVVVVGGEVKREKRKIISIVIIEMRREKGELDFILGAFVGRLNSLKIRSSRSMREGAATRYSHIELRRKDYIKH
jgi:hypothetical protein